jgi:hypothetical protein
VSTETIEVLPRIHRVREKAPHPDIHREKRLLRQAIAASTGPHRIRLQRELAALEEYEREKRRAEIKQATLA